MSRKPPKSRARRRARANPKPRAWSAKGPSRAYECKSPLVGRTVRLGRSEAVVESCATPSRRRPNQGQFRVRSKATGKSRAVPRRRVSAALYRAKHPRKMPAGLLKFWAKTREGGSARPSMAEAYGPRESLGVGAFEEARSLPHGPRESLGTGAFEERRALPAPTAPMAMALAAPVRERSARQHRGEDAGRSSNAPEPPLHFGPVGAETARPTTTARALADAINSGSSHTVLLALPNGRGALLEVTGPARATVGPGDAVAIASSDFTGGNLTIPDDAYVVVWPGKRVPGLFARGPTAGLTNTAVLGAVRSAAAHGHRPLLVGPMFEPPTTEFSGEFLGPGQPGQPSASGPGSVGTNDIQQAVRRVVMQFAALGGWRIGAWRSDSRSKWLREPRVERYYGRAFCSVTFRTNGEVRVNIVAGGTANIDNWLVASDVRRTDAASIMGAVDGRFAEQQTVPRESLTSDTDPTALVYGPHESLGVGAFEEARALPYGPRESLGTGAVEPLRPDARHLPRPSAYFAGPGGAETGRPRARSAKPKVETFARARARIFDEFKALGWDVHTKNTARSGRPLKVPYVTSRDGRQRLDFHAESVHADGHSIESDFRGATARRLIDLSARPNPSRWRANHHGGWHAPGDPLGYGPRANRTQTRRRSR